MKKDIAKSSVQETLKLFLKDASERMSWTTVGNNHSNLVIFIKWLDANQIELKNIDSKTIEKFTTSLMQKGNCIETRWRIRSLLYYYFEWLYKNEYPIRNPKEILPVKRPRSERIGVVLPKHATDYLDLIGSILNKSTWGTYRTSLRHFYKFIEKNKIDLRKIERKDTENFLKYVASKNLSPSTRISMTLVIRKHLHWLKEHKKIKGDPFLLVKTTDYPKLPVYLPRPLSPEIDQLVQKRCAASTDLCHKGLLLMRWTGIRVGELSKLPRDCVKIDFNGNAFLKVPLGKLNTERMVPLSSRILKLIDAIKSQVDQDIPIKDPQYLLVSPRGKQIPTHNLMFAFKEIVTDIKSQEPLVTHRLRHTYATELLTAGMNIFALRDILGHKDIAMTLLYAEVTQEKVRHEYFAALNRLETEQKYQQEVLSTIIPEEADYLILLRDLSLEVKRKIRSKKLPHQRFTQINKRIKRLQTEIATLIQ